jgi:hypothetical protein
MMFMRKYLLSSLKEYWDIARKRDALSLNLSSLDCKPACNNDPSLDPIGIEN